MYDIRNELNHRYKDLRVLYQMPSQEEIFNMVTKETPETFYIGKLVMASVTGFTHRKPQREQLDRANPVRNEETGLWQCPFCFKVSHFSYVLRFKTIHLEFLLIAERFSGLIRGVEPL